jgi:aldehyde dehydrogenase (NAD+)
MKNYSEIFEKQKAYFRSGETRSYEFRVKQLKKLKNIIKEHEDEIAEDIH